jgi:oxygen-independent coproporphyrinogen III oxidase
VLPLLSDLRHNRLDVARLPACVAEALYVHIPFCAHKCHYCDFYSITRQTPQRMTEFVDRVLREADLWREVTQVAIKPRTIFFGGGTPSLLSIDAMTRLIDGLARRIDVSAVDEFTIEINPATADESYFRRLRSLGVDRLSFGAQSFDPDELKTLERHHDPADVPAAIAHARDAGFKRLSIDLIYAVPGQTLADWSANLDAALALRLDHCSCYALTYEDTTPLAVRKRLGRVIAVDESTELAMMRLTRDRLSSVGIDAYEVSNFARKGQESRHNLNYWLGGNYLGLGPSGASHLTGWRFKNLPHLGEWEQAVDDRSLPAVDVEHLDNDARAAERMMLGLRLTTGVGRAEFASRFGDDPAERFATVLAPLVRENLVIIDTHIRLTDQALPVADGVAAQFLSHPTA